MTILCCNVGSTNAVTCKNRQGALQHENRTPPVEAEGLTLPLGRPPSRDRRGVLGGQGSGSVCWVHPPETCTVVTLSVNEKRGGRVNVSANGPGGG
jgi:hypothetical protein